MAENWMMLLTLPVFVAGLIWLHFESVKSEMPEGILPPGPGMLLLPKANLKLALRLALIGLAGCSLYAVLPSVNGLSPHSPWDLSQSWLVSLRQSRNLLATLYYEFWIRHWLLTLLLALYCVPPTLLCLLVRRRGTYGRSRPDWQEYRVYMGLGALMVLGCLWLAFDPALGPRQILRQKFGIATPLLSLDLLNALCVGYLAGRILNLRNPEPEFTGPPPRIQWSVYAIPALLGMLLFTSAGLVSRNAPALLSQNFNPLDKYGGLAVSALPDGGGIMVSSQSQKLRAFQSALARSNKAKDWICVDVHSLPSTVYRGWLEARTPLGWLTESNRHELRPIEVLRLLEQMATQHRLFYLHPGFGLIFELFYPEPVGSVYELKLRNTDSLEEEKLPGSAIRASEEFWSAQWQKELSPLAKSSHKNNSKPFLSKLGLMSVPFDQDRLLAGWCSMSLDGYAVALQRQGYWKEAQARFQQALTLNVNNFSAAVSLACNTNLQSGGKSSLAAAGETAERLGNFENLSLILNLDGPFDEPAFCYLLGLAFQKNWMLIQAAAQFTRTRTLAPDAMGAEFALGQVYSQLQMTEDAKGLLQHIRKETKELGSSSALDLEMSLLEANTWLAETNTSKASEAIQSLLRRYPNEPEIAGRAIPASLALGDFTNTLNFLKSRSRGPNDVASLNNQAALLIVAGDPAGAIPMLDQVLSMTNISTARLNRANARLVTHDYDGAEADYLELENSGNELERASFGLAVIAEHRGDTNKAAHYLQMCLRHTTRGSTLWNQARQRLELMNGAAPATKTD